LKGRAAARAVRVGAFVALGVGPRTPAGLLGRVVGERSAGGDTVLDVVPATLVEAVPAGSVRIGPVGAVDALAAPESLAPPPAAVRRTRVRAAAGLGRRFRSAFSCSGSVRAALSGSLALRLVPRFELDWSWGEVDRAVAAATLRGDAELAAGISAAGSCSLAQTRVGTWYAPPLRLAAGPIPVVIVPRTTLDVSGHAEARAAYEARIQGFVSATAGLRYDGRVHPIGSFYHDLSYLKPAVRARAAIGGRVIPSVTFLLYGQAGPRFDLGTGLELGVDPAATPWWKLTAPVELSAGLAVPGFAGLRIPQRTVFSRSIPVAQAEADPAPGPEPGPQPGPQAGPGSTPTVERARIGWGTAATDVDLHVWDEHGNHAWFANADAVPGGKLSGDDTDGFGPEVFLADSAGHTYTYALCYFDDRGAGPTSVTVRLTDPSGAIRVSTHTLARKGDGVLLGSSPAGAAYSAPAGWCER
jgi:hypothetical protein